MGSSTERPGAMTPKGFRLDIQGIRGFALLIVLAAHAGVPHADGGFVALDVFFVLSGFLITGLILQEVEKTGSISLLRFYARRARRLLPQAVTVLAFVAVSAYVVFPAARAEEVSGDVLGAALYYVNWRFLTEDVDYFAFEDALEVSPVLHYWSLSIEEQYYLMWPALLLLILVWARWAGRGPKLPMAITVAVVGLASLAYGIWYTGHDEDAAYFSTFGRIWEIVIGAFLAFVLPKVLHIPRWLSFLIVGGGLAAFLVSGLAYGSDTPYPGWQAVIPTVGAAAIIVGGTAAKMNIVTRALTIEPLQYLGRVSYSWYLWHWPFIMLATAEFGALTWRQSLVAIAVAWVPAHVTHHLIEERFRQSPTLARRPRRALAIGATGTATAVLFAIGLNALQRDIPAAPLASVEGAAAASREPLQRKVEAIRPTPREADDDKGRLHDDDCLVDGKDRHSPPCVYGDPDSDTTVVLLGDSHALQYFPALEPIAIEKGWRLVGLTRASCLIADVDYQPTCNAWRENTLRRIEEQEKPDLIVTSNAIDDRFRVKVGDDRLSRTASEPLLRAGQVRTLRRLKRTGAEVVVIRDQAEAPFEIADCVSENRDNLEECAFEPRRDALRAFDARAAEQVEGVKIIDPLPMLCPEKRCPAVVGNALVYRDTYHLSATYARTLSDWLERRLPAIGDERKKRKKREQRTRR